MTRKVAIGRALQLLGWMAMVYGGPKGAVGLLSIFMWVVLIEFVMMSTPDGW